MHNLSSKIEVITPERAKKDLEKAHGSNFIKLNIDHVNKYAREMRGGRWHPNGEAIKYNQQGILIDGQHRLSAAVKANQPFETVVVYGVESDINLDSGKKRTIADYLRHRGEKNAPTLAAALRLQYRYDQGTLESFRNAGKEAVTPQEINETLRRHPEIRKAVQWATRYKLVSTSSLVFVLYQAMRRDLKLASEFIEDLCRQINLGENDAARVLHERLLRIRLDKQKRVDNRLILAILIKGWNAYYEGRGINAQQLSLRESGRNSESFPKFLELNHLT